MRLRRARCEAIGAKHMAGVAANITAMLDEKCKRAGFDRAGAKVEIPIAEIVRLLAFEKFSGLSLPKSALRAAELWRPFIEERAGKHLERLSASLEDQKSFCLRSLALFKRDGYGRRRKQRRRHR